MNAAAAGAQTNRPGVAVAGEGFAWRQDLTGRFVLPSVVQAALDRRTV
jgi:hypothetical protein